MGAGAPSKYNAKYHDPWAFSLACDGRTDVEIAEAMGISERTLNRWKFVWEKEEVQKLDEAGKPILDKNGNPLFDVRMKPVLDESGEKRLSSFGEELFKGKAIADAQVEQSLYKSCTGYSVEEKEELVEVGRDGRPKPLKIKKTTKYVQPNVMAQMYWLNNRSRRSGKWSQRQEVAIEGTVDVKAEQQKIRDALDCLTDEQLDRELRRAEGMTKIATQIIENGELAFKTMVHMDEYGYNNGHQQIPVMLEAHTKGGD